MTAYALLLEGLVSVETALQLYTRKYTFSYYPGNLVYVI